eukprot:1154537-Pelagomonas_calceolata.AAC.1
MRAQEGGLGVGGSGGPAQDLCAPPRKNYFRPPDLSEKFNLGCNQPADDPQFRKLHWKAAAASKNLVPIMSFFVCAQQPNVASGVQGKLLQPSTFRGKLYQPAYGH